MIVLAHVFVAVVAAVLAFLVVADFSLRDRLETVNERLDLQAQRMDVQSERLNKNAESIKFAYESAAERVGRLRSDVDQLRRERSRDSDKIGALTRLSSDFREATIRVAASIIASEARSDADDAARADAEPEDNGD